MRNDLGNVHTKRPGDSSLKSGKARCLPRDEEGPASCEDDCGPRPGEEKGLSSWLDGGVRGAWELYAGLCIGNPVREPLALAGAFVGVVGTERDVLSPFKVSSMSLRRFSVASSRAESSCCSAGRFRGVDGGGTAGVVLAPGPPILAVESFSLCISSSHSEFAPYQQRTGTSL